MENHEGGQPDWMTEAYMGGILNKNGEVLRGMSVGPGSSVGDNYAGQIFRIKAILEKNGVKETRLIIAKYLKPTSITNDFATEGADFFEVEANMLQTLPRFVPEEIYPKCLHVDVPHKTLYLEDLCPKGYRMAERAKFLDLPHCQLVVKALATLHARGYLYIQTHPEIKQEFSECVFREGNPGMEKMMKNGHDAILQYMDGWGISESWKTKIRNLEKDLLPKAIRCYTRQPDSMNVLLHGDCWKNNMLFKYEGSTPAAVTLLDFQGSNYNSNAAELVYFLMTSSDGEVRSSKMSQILETYYKMFISVTGNIPGYTLEVLKKDFRDRLFFGLMCTLIFTPIMAKPKDEFVDMAAILQGKDPTEENRAMFTNPLYVEIVKKSLSYLEQEGVF